MTYHDTLNAKAYAFFGNDPDWAVLSAQTFARLREGFYEQDIVDAIFQNWDRHDTRLVDAFWFAHIYTLLWDGDIVCGYWDIGQAPGGDDDIEGNNRKLSTLHRVGIIARFDPMVGYASAEGDGYFAWTRPITLGQVLLDGKVKEVKLPADRLPLEVGYTRPTATYRHLLVDGGVARWAYGSTKMWVFKTAGELAEPW